MEKKRDTKRKIIQAALEIFPELGFENTSMRLIAEKCGITKPAVYYYFKNKEELFQGLVNIGHDHSIHRVGQIAESDINIQKKLAEILLMRFKVFPKHPKVKKFIGWTFTNGGKFFETNDFLENIDEFKNMLIDIIQTAIDNKELSNNLNVEHFIAIMIGTSNYYSKQHFIFDLPPLSQEEAENIVNILLNGAL